MTQDLDINVDSVSKAFKAYDVRGKIPDELNPAIIQYIGNNFGKFLDKSSGSIVVGFDVRPTSFEFSKALVKGITDYGLDVINIGLCGTDMVYFATAKLNAIGGIMITASHNPADYNGLKFVREQAIPISGDTGLRDIRDSVIAKTYTESPQKGKEQSKNIEKEYIDHILSFVNVDQIPRLKVVMNGGNGCAGVVLPQLMKKIPQIEAVPMYWEQDGSFPNGIPNPLLPDQREETSRKVIDEQADLGVAWDGDFDRCFFYDNQGNFIEGYYLVGLYAKFVLKNHPGAKILHDPRLVWATVDIINSSGGIPIETKAGHAFIKERMRKEDAVYAGEMSAHHYFKKNYFADNGMIPMLLLFQILGATGQSLNQLVSKWMEKYPVSGEINITVSDAAKVFEEIEKQYATHAQDVSYTDGVSISFENWRFNLRKSNTEPVIRLNVESRHDAKLMERKRDELMIFIKNV